jgi:hypothetical protein
MTSKRARMLIGLSICGAMCSSSLVASAQAQCFTKLASGCAKSIAAGDGTSPWVIGCGGPVATAYYWDSASGTQGSWVKTNVSGADIGVIYMQASYAGFGPAYASSCSTGGATVPAGTPPLPAMNLPLLISASGEVQLGTPSGSDIQSTAGASVTLQSLGGCASSISGTTYPRTGGCFEFPFVTGCTPAPGGDYPYYGEFQYGAPLVGAGAGAGTNGWNRFTSLAGAVETIAGTRISVSQDSTTTSTYLLNSQGQLWIRGPGFRTDWALQPSPAQGCSIIDVSAPGGDPTYGPAWIVDNLNGLEYWNGSGWSLAPNAPPATKVSVGDNGTVWVIDTSGAIWHSDGSCV